MLKKVLSLIIVLCLILPAYAVYGDSGDFHIKIVHTGDIRARIIEDEDNGVIGIEKLGAFIDAQKSDCDISLALDSGDAFHGQPIATLVKGESVAEVIKACGYDAMTAGNHDWSYGTDRLKELVQTADVKMLTGNVTYNSEKFFDDEFLIKTAQVGGKELKVGIFGVIDPETKSLIAPEHIRGIEFTDAVQYADRASEYLRNQGCNIVIALTHSKELYSLAEKVGGVDLWLAGHEYLDGFKELKDKDGKKTYVIESDHYLNSVNLIEITGNMKSDNIKVTVDKKDLKDCGKKAEVTEVLNSIEEQYEAIIDTKVCESPVDLNGENKDIRKTQQNMGNVIADAYLWETGADVAFENAGGICASIKSGDVTYGDIIGVSPFGDYVVTKEVTGEDIKEIMETSIDIQLRCTKAYESGDESAVPQESGDSLQFGGMLVTFNPDKPKGERVMSIAIGGEPIDEKATYTVATNNYVAGMYLYPQLADNFETAQYSSCDEILISYFSKGGDIIKRSASYNRLFSVNESDSFIDISSYPNASVYVPSTQNAVFLTLMYDDNGELIFAESKTWELSAGMNFIAASPIIEYLTAEKIKVIFWDMDNPEKPVISSKSYIYSIKKTA